MRATRRRSVSRTDSARSLPSSSPPVTIRYAGTANRPSASSRLASCQETPSACPSAAKAVAAFAHTWIRITPTMAAARRPSIYPMRLAAALFSVMSASSFTG